jgi:hypothetical protein
VVPENAYTEDGRDSVKKKASQFTSIRNTGGFTMAAGTRYHPSDIYDTWKNQQYELYDEEGELIDRKAIWEITEFAVEKDNIFLWPRSVGENGKAFGFDRNSLSRIYGEYEDKVQFYAQYYNDPNDPGSNRITRDRFQYLDPKQITYSNGSWYARGKRLNVYAAIDFAYTVKKNSDYTAIVVIGIDHEGYIYVLDIDRFKTDKIATMYDHVSSLHAKWNFRRIRAEVTAAQSIIAGDLKDRIREEGRSLSVDEFRPSSREGTKEERIAAILEPRYENLIIFHTKGGYTSAVEIARKPGADRSKQNDRKIVYGRFGGVAFR